MLRTMNESFNSPVTPVSKAPYQESQDLSLVLRIYILDHKLFVSPAWFMSESRVAPLMADLTITEYATYEEFT